MSYTTTIKNEIVSVGQSKVEVIAFLSGFIRNNAIISDDSISLFLENKYVVDYLVKLIEDTYIVNVIIDVKNNLNFSKNVLYVLEIKESVQKILEDISYFDEKGKRRGYPKEYIVSDNQEIRAYLKGVFLSQGSINDPKTSQYHMEILINYKDEAVFVQKLLNIFDLNAKILTRDKGYMIYIKDSEKISDFLKIINASKAVMYYENIRIYRDKKNQTNRLNNCEQANTNKVIDTAAKQLHYIEIIRKNMGIDLLDDKTKETLIYREKYPEVSLKELSEIITLETSKSITKSGLNHRFRKIKDLANKFENK